MKTAHWLAALAGLLLGWLPPAPCRGAEEPSPEVRQALQVLSQGTQPGQPAAAPERQHHALRAGESLDAVIRHHFPASPLRPEVLRECFVKVNPKAFPNGRAGRLPAGTVLQVPTRDELMVHAFGAPPMAAPSAARAGSPATAAASAAESSPPEARRWVRFP